MATHNRLMAVLFVSVIAIAVDTANAKKPANRGDADAGRDLALVRHRPLADPLGMKRVVSDDQPFAPFLNGPPGVSGNR